MNYRPIHVLVCAVLLVLGPAVASAAAIPINLRDFRQLIHISSPRFSPNGRQIAFLTISSDYVRNRYDQTLRVMDTDDGKSRVLIHGMHALAAPDWSPDGRTLTFIADVGKQSPQIYAVSAEGGMPVELSHAPNGVEQYAWKPDGHTIAYVTPDNSPLSAQDREDGHDLFTIHDDDYQITEAPVPSHIWLLSLSSGKARQITFGSTSVLENAPPLGGSISAPAWSTDGRWIVYTQQADADDSDSDQTSIAAVNVATGAEHQVTSQHSNEYTPSFAPRGDTVAYLYPHGPGPISNMDIFLASIAGGATRDVSAGLDRDIYATYAWLPNAGGLVALANDHIGSKLYVQPLRGRGYALALGDLNPLDLAVSSQGALAFVADSATSAPELYLLRTLAGHPVRLTDFNRSLSAYAYPHTVEVSWKAPDGEANDGLLTYPNGYTTGRHYPLVIYLHGGPEESSSVHFDAGVIGPLREVFAAQGFLVFEPNYRGSDNLGNAHEHAIYRDPAVGPSSDVMSGLTLLEQKGIVDESRIAAAGHSYGGYMTAWLIAHQHFWRCAVVGAGIVDWTEDFELAGDGNMAMDRDSLGGTPWDADSAELYRSASPITYATQITTPTLILSGTADTTVPITQSFALFHALSSRHVPVTFIGIPGASHSVSDPVHRELYFSAVDKWVVAYLGP